MNYETTVASHNGEQVSAGEAGAPAGMTEAGMTETDLTENGGADSPRSRAKTGVGVKGNSLDGIQGNDARLLMAGPVKAYFNAREKIIFDIALPKSAQLFNAINDRNPKTHEEYMKEVVESAQIKLPELPAGMVYRYRPDVNELWVEAEKKKD